MGSDLRSRLPVAAPAAFVALIVVVAMVRVFTQHWREGALLLGGALLVAAVLRTLLPTDRVGLLAIRSKAVDVGCCVGFGMVMLVLAVTITRGSLGSG